MLSFIWGIHPTYNKLTKKSKIEVAELPKKVILPLSQHTGAPCAPLVNISDKVTVGQKIAESDKPVSSPIHASISGIVREISIQPHPVLNKCKAIVIEQQGNQELNLKKREDIDALEKEDLLKIIKEAGIVGLGGAAFPTHIKLNPPKNKPIDTIIINGAECEPYLTCDHRVMLEHQEEIIDGLLIMKKILKAKNLIIAIEDNKENAAQFLKNKLLEKDLDKKITIEVIPTIYPQGAEKTLIYTVTKRKVPSGGLPMDIGCVVSNVQTAKAIFEAVYYNKPLIERVITITGAISQPKNILVRIGTPYNELIQLPEDTGKIISGGPMMGIAQYTDEVPVIKGTSGILIQKKKDIITEDSKDCIRCSRCVDACPMELMPNLITRYTKNNMIDQAKNFYPLDCFECGACSYVCPSKIPLVHWIKTAKKELMKK
ncbi:MAG: electron transport complex subunit RsxC [Nanoarchaeota archaeon]